MRIAFVSTVHGHRWPGSEYLWSQTAAALLASGDQVFARVSCDTREAKELRSLQDAGLQVEFESGRQSLARRVVRRIIGVSRLRELARFRPDGIVVSSGSAFDPVYQPSVARELMEATAPFILICHFNAETFWLDDRQRGVMREVYSKAAATVFVSEDNRRLTERQLAMSLADAVVIRPPFPLVLERPVDWSPPGAGPWQMACVARLDTRWKGQDVLFEVLAESSWRQRNWRLNLYGEGEEEAYLKRLADYYGIADRVHFRGFVTDREEIWRENHIQVFPSRGEGGPMVLTEGMMAGRAAVITECGNVREYVTDGDDGFVAGFACPSIFGPTMERAWEARADWNAMGRRAHERIRGLRVEPPHEALLSLIGKHVGEMR